MNQKKAATPKEEGLIYQQDGEPFANRRAATLQMGLMKKKKMDVRIVEVEGGFALRQLDPDEAAKRPKRVPLGTRQILTAPARQGYQRRFVNDTGNRIEMFIEAGWSLVTDDDVRVGDKRAGLAKHVGSPVSKNVGMGVTAYLMEIPQELYDERQAEKAANIDRGERAMMLQSEGEGAYGDVKIDRR